jgi:hypothetical protein
MAIEEPDDPIARRPHPDTGHDRRLLRGRDRQDRELGADAFQSPSAAPGDQAVLPASAARHRRRFRRPRTSSSSSEQGEGTRSSPLEGDGTGKLAHFTASRKSRTARGWWPIPPHPAGSPIPAPRSASTPPASSRWPKPAAWPASPIPARPRHRQLATTFCVCYRQMLTRAPAGLQRPAGHARQRDQPDENQAEECRSEHARHTPIRTTPAAGFTPSWEYLPDPLPLS